MMFPTPEMIEAAKAIAEKIAKAMEGAYDGEWSIEHFEARNGDDWGLIVNESSIIAEIRGALDQCGNGENAEYIIATQPKNMRVLLSAFDSLYAVPALQPVSVKALEWEVPSPFTNHCWIAKSPFGTYSVVNEDGWYAAREPGDFWEWNGDRIIDTRDSAFRACEADYAARIRSALSSPVERGTEKEGLAEALRRISKLTPARANAQTANDLHLTVKAIAETALDAVFPSPSAEIEALRVENERLRSTLIETGKTLENYADPTAYFDCYGEQLESNEESHPGLLAADTLATVRAVLQQQGEGK